MNIPVTVRFWKKVRIADSNSCWTWKGARTSSGYGSFWDGTRVVYSHRYVYELLREPIPEGFEIDHLCRNVSCVNPDHLEAVTHTDNILRGVSPGAKAVRTDKCHKGHPLTGSNVTTYPGKSGRWCKACAKERNQRRYPSAVRALSTMTLLAVMLLVGLTGTAQARSTEAVMYEILHERGSPLAAEAYTLVAFRRYHGPDFNMINFVSLLWAESNLGRDRYVRRHHNVSSIKGGPVGTLWRDLRTGTFGGGFNEYPTFRAGQRAALRLVMRYYGGDIRTGLHTYYGVGVTGWYGYKRNFDAARQILLREGREHGLNPVHR